jgi:peptide/nickel transport system permease protein
MSVLPTPAQSWEEERQPDAGLVAEEAAPAAASTKSQTYLRLVWRRFHRSKPGIVGLVLVALILLVTIFAEFFSPYDPSARNRDSIYLPPQSMHFFDADGFHLVPFTYPLKIELDPATFLLETSEDRSVQCQPAFLGRGWSYRFLGIELDRHLFSAPPDCPYHLLGTDFAGRDMLSRIISGGRLTLLMAGIVVTISVLIGAIMGIVSGYYGGTVDHWLQRIVEFTLALPDVPFYFALVAIIPRNADPFLVFLLLAGILSLLRWAQLAREVRGKTLAISHLDYITAAEAVGAGPRRIVFRHILPNVMSHIVVVITLAIPTIVLIESFLSFLGLGVQPPLVSWGLLLNAGKDLQNLGSYPWVLTPVFAILATVLSFNMLGDGLRDAIDPYQA